MYDDVKIAALVRGILEQRSRLAFDAAQRGIHVDDLLAAAITRAIREELFTDFVPTAPAPMPWPVG